MNELQKLLENAGMVSEIDDHPMTDRWNAEDWKAHQGNQDTITAIGADGVTYSVYTDETNRVVIGADGVEFAVGVLLKGRVVETSIQDPASLIQALLAFVDN